jgi:hypothetical protein
MSAALTAAWATVTQLIDDHIQSQCRVSALQVQLDYSSVSREHRAASDGKAREKLAGQFQADIEERSSLLAKLAPNLKAMEQYEAVKVCFPAM